ncbi:MAG: GTPase HflX [Candidatus Dormibacteria bacterium]
MLEVGRKAERAYLLGVQLEGTRPEQLRDEMDELAELARTAGAQVVGEEVQRRRTLDPASFIGSGKMRELADLRYELDLSLLISNDDLSPRQQRNLEKSLDLKVIDRTELILDIFAQRAATHEGRIQVEAAQLRHLLPRLIGGRDLSRLGGGIGTRGPGEQKLEVDRRRIRRRLSDLEKELKEVARTRRLHRERRARAPMPVVALTGYTNSGKSTLLNALTRAGVVAEDKLFATLDPTTRKVKLPGGQECLLTDTVGFIQKLPTDLVAAFRSTLEEVVFADVVLHVVDLGAPNFEERMDAVDRVLMELGAGEKPAMGAFNKVDRLTKEELTLRLAEARHRLPGMPISALKGSGLEALLGRVETKLGARSRTLRLLVPYADAAVAAEFHRLATVESAEYLETGIALAGRVALRDAARFAPYLKSRATRATSSPGTSRPRPPR